ncbi:MAG: flagellar export protein FliJ [Chitinispirillales bacterium]|jgi:flagellar FliJ protein|nr:flagellar export protein FliJ [Chitinispirillales bacterium]
MKKFKFSLEALLSVKKKKEEDVKMRLAKKNREAEETRKSIENIQNKLREFQAAEKERRGSASENIVSLRNSVAYRNAMKLELLNEGRKLDNIMAAVHAINQELIKASQERRAVEIIKENRFAEWKRQNNVQEQKFIDDISQQAFIREKKASAQRGS